MMNLQRILKMDSYVQMIIIDIKLIGGFLKISFRNIHSPRLIFYYKFSDQNMWTRFWLQFIKNNDIVEIVVKIPCKPICFKRFVAAFSFHHCVHSINVKDDSTNSNYGTIPQKHNGFEYFSFFANFKEPDDHQYGHVI